MTDAQRAMFGIFGVMILIAAACAWNPWAAALGAIAIAAAIWSK